MMDLLRRLLAIPWGLAFERTFVQRAAALRGARPVSSEPRIAFVAADVSERSFIHSLLAAMDADAIVVEGEPARRLGLAYLFHDRVLLPGEGRGGPDLQAPGRAALTEAARELARRRGFAGLEAGPPAPGSLRILLYVPGFDQVGGAERQAAAQARELARRGHRPLVLTNTADEARPVLEARDGVTVVRLAPPTPPGFWPWKQARTLRAFLLRHGGAFDLLHAHSYTDVTGTLVAAARGLGLRSLVKVATQGDVARLHRTLVPVRRVAGHRIRHADRLLALSSAIRDELVSVGIPAARIVELSNGVDAELFRPADPARRAAARERLGLPADALVACFVGRLEARKAVDVLLRAFASVRDPRARLLVVGDGEERPRLDRLHADLGLGPRAVLLGARADAPEVLAAADVFAFLSRREGQPNAVIEAMATGLPVVAARAPGVSELVETAAGILVPPDDAPAATAALEALFADPARRRALGEAARRRVEARYALPAIVDRLVGIYGEVLGSLKECR